MSRIFSRAMEKKFIVLAGVLLIVSTAFLAFVALSIGPTYVIRVNSEPWTVTGTKAVQEFSYSNTYFTGSGERGIIYPGLAYDIFLEINLTAVSGSLDFSVESAGEVLFEVTDATEIITTLSIEATSLRIFESPHESNVTLQGYIKAYCWLPASSAPLYYFRSIFGGGD